MTKKYLSFLFTLLLFLAVQGVFATTRYWVGASGGSYSVATNWNTQSNGLGTSGTPINTDDIVIDRSTSIIIDGTYLPSSLWVTNNAIVVFTTTASRTYTIGGGSVSPAFKIEAGSTLNVQGTAAITIEMASASAAHIFGTLDFTGTSSKMNYSTGPLSGTTTIKTGGKLRYGGVSANGTGSTTSFFMDSASVYEIYKNGGSVPTGSYNPNSLILITGSVANLPTLLMNTSTGSYGNIEFNAPLSTNTTVGFNNNYTFNNFTITNDGSGKCVFSTSTVNSYSLTINGNLTLAPGTTLDINRGASGSQATTIFLKGNLRDSGLITESNGNTGSVIEFGGTQNANIICVSGGITNDVSVKMNKTSGKIIALSDIELPNSPNALLTLASGNIDMKANNKVLYVQNPSSGSIPVSSAGSHIIGKLKRSANQSVGYDFPISNNDAQWAKATITPSNTTLTQWTMEFITPNPFVSSGLTPGIIDEVSNYYWDVTASGTASPSMNFIKLYYDGLSNASVFIPSQVKVVRWDGSWWDNMGGNNASGNVASTLGTSGTAAPADPIVAFGPFTLGGISNTLPVTLEYFNGARLGNAHKLSWKVNCTGTPGVQMTLERGVDSRNFNSIYSFYANVDDCRSAFEKTDLAPLRGVNYYRIVLTDLDGRKTFSRIIVLNNMQEAMSASVAVYPNPSAGNAVVSLSVASKTEGKIVITDNVGREVKSINITLSEGSNQLPVDISSLSAGIYNVTVITNQGERFTTKLIRN